MKYILQLSSSNQMLHVSNTYGSRYIDSIFDLNETFAYENAEKKVKYFKNSGTRNKDPTFSWLSNSTLLCSRLIKIIDW